MLSFEINGGEEQAEAVINACRIWMPATSLGSVESLIERRARWKAARGVILEQLLAVRDGEFENPRANALVQTMIPFLLAAIMVSWFGLQQRKWQQGGKE